MNNVMPIPVANCSHIVVDLLRLMTPPMIKLRMVGPDRWGANSIRISVGNGYQFYYGMPNGFAAGTAEEAELIFQSAYKFI